MSFHILVTNKLPGTLKGPKNGFPFGILSVLLVTKAQFFSNFYLEATFGCREVLGRMNHRFGSVTRWVEKGEGSLDDVHWTSRAYWLAALCRETLERKMLSSIVRRLSLRDEGHNIQWEATALCAKVALILNICENERGCEGMLGKGSFHSFFFWLWGKIFVLQRSKACCSVGLLVMPLVFHDTQQEVKKVL